MQNPRASRRCSDLISLNCWLCLVSETTWNDVFLESATSPCCQCWVVSNSLWPHELYVACKAPLPMEFSRQEYWSGVSFPPPGDLPNPGVGPASPALAGVPLRKPQDLLPHIALMYCFTLPQKSFHSDSCLASPNPRKVEKRRYCSFSFYRRIGH